MPASKKYIYDSDYPEHAIWWIQKHCVHYIGEKKDQPFMLDRWQKDVINNLLGWRVASNPKYLKHSTLWLEVPRGNGKSTFATALGLYLAFGVGIDSAKVYCFASSKDQSLESVFLPAKYMSEHMNSEYGAGLSLYHNNVEDKETNSTFRLMSADWRGAHSLVGSAFIIDEIHLHTNSKLFDGIDSGAAKRTDCTPLKIICTTSGEQSTFGEEQHLYAKSVLDGTIPDESYLVYIFTAGEQPKDDPDYYFRPETQRKANPGFEFINQHEFAAKALRAERSKAFLANYLRYNLNVWVGSAQGFIPKHEWDRCNKGKVALTDLMDYECYAGLYFMHVRDLICMSLFFPELCVLKRWFWCPSEKLRDRIDGFSPFADWVDAGYIRKVPGNAHNFKEPAAVISELLKKLKIRSFEVKCREINFIEELNKTDLPVNTWSMTHNTISPPTTKLEELVLTEALNHEGNPVSDYMMGKVGVVLKDDQVKIHPDSSAEVVCGPIADVLAIGGWMDAEPDSESVYESHGIRSV